MKLFDFKCLSIPEQVSLLYDQGVYVGKRRNGSEVLLLYQLDSFYVEVRYWSYRRHVKGIRCSAGTAILDPYLEQIEIELLAG